MQLVTDAVRTERNESNHCDKDEQTPSGAYTICADEDLAKTRRVAGQDSTSWGRFCVIIRESVVLAGQWRPRVATVYAQKFASRLDRRCSAQGEDRAPGQR